MATYILDDEMLTKFIANNVKVRIRSLSYIVDPVCKEFKVGDFVLDRGDGTWGCVRSMDECGVAISSDNFTEGCISLDRLVKLVQFFGEERQ